MRSNPLSERKTPRFFPVYANTNRPFSRALDISDCPTQRHLPSPSGGIYHILLIDVNRTQARERPLFIGGGRFRAATENPAAALLPTDSLVAHLPACRAATAESTARVLANRTVFAA